MSIYKYSPESYNLENLRDGALTKKQMQQEYAHLREIARKRVANLQKHGLTRNSDYMVNKDKFQKTASKMSARELMYGLSDIKRFLDREGSTVRGQKKLRKKAIDSLHEYGIDFVNEQNFSNFVDFMEYSRMLGLVNIYGSERMLEVFRDNSDGEKPESLAAQFSKFEQEQRKKIDFTDNRRSGKEVNKMFEEFKNRKR